MDYGKLSDFEINKAVAEIAISGDWFLEPTDESPSWFFNLGVESKNTVKLPDYCNRPDDAWPIISANRISVEYDSEDQCDVPAEWVTAYGIDGLKVHVVAHQPCDKALRSAMIVFLMMQESSNVPVNSTGSDIR